MTFPPENVDHAAIARAVAGILASADADIAARRPVCRASGRCCQFEHYGHRLYVTTAEILHFAHVQGIIPETRSTPSSFPPPDLTPLPPACPYQVAGLCTAREARPLGCRVYFCDPAAQAWQNDLYETYHAQLKALHATHRLPYRYVEWRQALREAGIWSH